MWGPATAPGLPSQAVPPPQAAANPNSRFTEDAATLLDFPDWDGPGLLLPLPHVTRCTH